MPNGPIDRKNRDDILKQIGRVESDIQHINQKHSKFDKELDSWPKRREHLLKMKKIYEVRISAKHKYLKELESDLMKLKSL